jgi:thiol-disulfide isomerase/thioredoxin
MVYIEKNIMYHVYDDSSSSESDHDDHCVNCTSCGKSLDEEKSNRPVVYVFGKELCPYADRAKVLIEDEKNKREDSCIDMGSVFEVKDVQELRNMQPVFKTSPRVYIDYSNSPKDDIEFNANNFLGGYTELAEFIKKQRVGLVDASIQHYVSSHESKNDKIFLVVAATWCGICKSLQSKLKWNNQPSRAIYRSNDAAALCFTMARNESLVSNVLRGDEIVITGYPTLLEYSRRHKKWEVQDDRSVLTNRKWSL